MEHWNWKKDLIWGLGLTAVLIGVYYAWQEFLAWQASQTAAQSNAANAAAATAAENSAQLSTEVAQIQSYTAGAAPVGSTGSVVASAAAGASTTASTPISPGAQISSVSSDTVAALIANLGSIKSPTPVLPVAVAPLSQVTGSPSPNTSQSTPNPVGVSAPVIASAPAKPPAPTNIKTGTADAVKAPTSTVKPPSVSLPQNPIASVPTNLKLNPQAVHTSEVS